MAQTDPTSHEGASTDALAEPETDAGPGQGRARSPERRCIATMERRPQADMIRFVLSPDGVVTPDLAAKLPGRGAWVLASREALAAAVKRNAFSRAFKAPARIEDGLIDQVEALIVKGLLDRLGLARRSGELAVGFEGVREAIRLAPPGVVIEASDGAADSRGKVLALLLGVHGADSSSSGAEILAQGEDSGEQPPYIPVVGCFSSLELGMALGRERVIHACLRSGRFAQNWLDELRRLAGFRRLQPLAWTSPKANGAEDVPRSSAAGRIGPTD